MATDQRALPAYFNNDADFRSWGSGINAQFTACGLTQTSDTGQVNWTTVTKAAAINTAQGYEIWRFADTLQSTRPVYIKVEYGSGGATDRPSLWVTVGTGTNGSGTLTGVLSTRQQCNATSSKSAGTTLNSYCSGSSTTGRIMLMNNIDPASSTFYMGFAVERIADGTGTASGNAVAFHPYSSNFGHALFQLIPYAGSASSQANTPVLTVDYGLASFGGDVAVYPMLYPVGRMYLGWSLCYKDTTFTQLVSLTATHLGASRTFLPLGNAGVGQWGPTGWTLAMIWE